MTQQEIDRARAAKTAYMKEWRRENKEKNREYQRKWRQKNAEKVKQYQIHYWARRQKKMEAGNDGKDITTQGR
jgi:hypothetical protein